MPTQELRLERLLPDDADNRAALDAAAVVADEAVPPFASNEAYSVYGSDPRSDDREAVVAAPDEDEGEAGGAAEPKGVTEAEAAEPAAASPHPAADRAAGHIVRHEATQGETVATEPEPITEPAAISPAEPAAADTDTTRATADAPGDEPDEAANRDPASGAEAGEPADEAADGDNPGATGEDGDGGHINDNTSETSDDDPEDAPDGRETEAAARLLLTTSGFTNTWVGSDELRLTQDLYMTNGTRDAGVPAAARPPGDVIGKHFGYEIEVSPPETDPDGTAGYPPVTVGVEHFTYDSRGRGLALFAKDLPGSTFSQPGVPQSRIFLAPSVTVAPGVVHEGPAVDVVIYMTEPHESNGTTGPGLVTEAEVTFQRPTAEIVAPAIAAAFRLFGIDHAELRAVRQDNLGQLPKEVKIRLNGAKLDQLNRFLMTHLPPGPSEDEA